MKLDKILEAQRETVQRQIDELDEAYAKREADELKITGDMKALKLLARMQRNMLKRLGSKKSEK